MSKVTYIKISTGKPVEFTKEAWEAIKGTPKEKSYKAVEAKKLPPPEILELEGTDTQKAEAKASKRKLEQNKAAK